MASSERMEETGEEVSGKGPAMSAALLELGPVIGVGMQEEEAEEEDAANVDSLERYAGSKGGERGVLIRPREVE